MSIRDLIIDAVGGRQLREETAKVQQAFGELYQAYIDGPFLRTPQQLTERLSELDSSTLADLLANIQGDRISALIYGTSPDDQRRRQVNESRRMWLNAPLAQWCVWTWTNNGLGESVTVTCTDPAAQERWRTTWDASRIFYDDEIQNLSNFTLVDGDVYLVAFVSIVDGSVLFEQLDTDEIKEIITYPENKNRPLYYRRDYTDADGKSKTLYYPDWQAFYGDSLYASRVTLPLGSEVSVSEVVGDGQTGTTAVVLHIAHNRKDIHSLHGWPILGIASPYMRSHNQYLESRLTVAKQKASFVREMSTVGGSRAVAALKTRFDSQLGPASSSTGSTYIDPNPPQVAGSTLIHNDAVKHTDLPMTTGAGDATSDNAMFSWIALIGAGLFPTTAGLDTSRWATAVAMDKTQAVQWSRYQTFWSCQFRKMVEIVLLSAERYGNEQYPDKTCTVSIDTLSLVDFPGVVGPIAQMIGAGITPSVADGTMPPQAAKQILQELWSVVLTALGAERKEDILSDENMGIVSPEQTAETINAMAAMARAIRDERIAEKDAWIK